MVTTRRSTGRSGKPTPAWTIAVLAAICCTGCSTFWPRIVAKPAKPQLFDSGFPLVGGARSDGALCSLVTVGPEATRLVDVPESLEGAVSLEEACRVEAHGIGAGQRGRVAQLVTVNTTSGMTYGYLYGGVPSPTGLLVTFSGLAMPPAGWINERFAEKGARRGLITFAPVRDEKAQPIYFDPVREAVRALEAATQIATACRLGPSARLGFVGISMGGFEALLANREALRRGMATRAAVLDPVLDVERVTDNLDSYWHSFAVDSMQAYFRRIIALRYKESPLPTFREIMDRTRTHAGAMTHLEADQPSAWLCGAKRDAYAVFLSSSDPVLGNAQRSFGDACGFEFRRRKIPGHTPLACALPLFDEMLEAAVPGELRAIAADDHLLRNPRNAPKADGLMLESTLTRTSDAP